MKMRVLGLVAATVFAVAAMSAPAVAGNGYGNQIKTQCDGASYGQLVKAAKQSGHVIGPVRGAKYFATVVQTSGPANGLTLLDFHCPQTPA